MYLVQSSCQDTMLFATLLTLCFVFLLQEVCKSMCLALQHNMSFSFWAQWLSVFQRGGMWPCVTIVWFVFATDPLPLSSWFLDSRNDAFLRGHSHRIWYPWLLCMGKWSETRGAKRAPRYGRCPNSEPQIRNYFPLQKEKKKRCWTFLSRLSWCFFWGCCCMPEDSVLFCDCMRLSFVYTSYLHDCRVESIFGWSIYLPTQVAEEPVPDFPDISYGKLGTFPVTGMNGILNTDWKLLLQAKPLTACEHSFSVLCSLRYETHWHIEILRASCASCQCWMSFA